MIFMLAIVLIRLPMSWHKVRGGQQVEWIGYMLDMARFEIGISTTRAAWATRWLTDKAAPRKGRMYSIGPAPPPCP